MSRREADCNGPNAGPPVTREEAEIQAYAELCPAVDSLPPAPSTGTAEGPYADSWPIAVWHGSQPIDLDCFPSE